MNVAFAKAGGQVLEPIMSVALSAPTEFQGTVISLLNKRRGTIQDSEVRDDYVDVTAMVPLNDMFGFSTDLRSATQGKGEFSMEFNTYQPCIPSKVAELVEEKRKADVKK